MTDSIKLHRLIICLPDNRQLEIGPVAVDKDSVVTDITKRITMKFATKELHWVESVLVIEHRNRSYHIPYRMFTAGKAYWFVEDMDDD